jgi:hypothetical protein
MLATATLGTTEDGCASQSVMRSQGKYDEYAEPQRRTGASGLPLLAAAAQTLVLPSDERPLVVVDYGSATGRNSAAPLRTIVDNVRRRAPSVPLTIYHNDQPANDFSSLFAWLEGPSGYLREVDGVFTYASGRSFYQRLFPDEYVDLGWSANAAHWLSRVPVQIPNHLSYRRGAPGLDDPFCTQAAEDWSNFVEHRAHELRVGGHLVVVVVSANDHGDSGGDHFVDVINEVLIDLLAAGKLQRREYERMAIATYFRTATELEAPFRSGRPSAALALEAHEHAVLPDPIGERYDTTGDAAAFATAFTGWLRGFSEPSLLGALDPERGPEQVATLTGELYDSIQTRVARNPTRVRCHWRVSQLLVTKRAPM